MQGTSRRQIGKAAAYFPATVSRSSPDRQRCDSAPSSSCRIACHMVLNEPDWLPPIPAAPGPLFSLLALGALGTGVAYVLTVMAAGRVGATKASATAFLIPPVALLLGVLVRGEHVAALSVFGGVVCLAGAWLMWRAQLEGMPNRSSSGSEKSGTTPFAIEHTVGREHPGRAIGVAQGHPSFPRVHEPYQANPAGEILAHFFLDLEPPVPRRKDLDGEIRRTEDELLGDGVGRETGDAEEGDIRPAHRVRLSLEHVPGLDQDGAQPEPVHVRVESGAEPHGKPPMHAAGRLACPGYARTSSRCLTSG